MGKYNHFPPPVFIYKLLPLCVCVVSISWSSSNSYLESQQLFGPNVTPKTGWMFFALSEENMILRRIFGLRRDENGSGEGSTMRNFIFCTIHLI